MNRITRNHAWALLSIGALMLLISGGCDNCGPADTAPDVALREPPPVAEHERTDMDEAEEVPAEEDVELLTPDAVDDELPDPYAEAEDAPVLSPELDDRLIDDVNGRGALPDGFPDDVPLHDSMEVYMSLTDGASGFTIQAASDAAAYDLVDFYKFEAGKEGWVETMEAPRRREGSMQALIFEKNGRNLNLVFTEGDDGTSVSLNVTR